MHPETMRFLVDSCVSSFAVKALRGNGHDVTWIPETGRDPGDDEVIQRSFSEGRILVTEDKDFGDLVFVYNRPHDSIIRLVAIPAKEQGRVLLDIIETHQAALNGKSLITVDARRIRVRASE